MGPLPGQGHQCSRRHPENSGQICQARLLVDSSVTQMLKDLEWTSLQDRRMHHKLTLLYKITNELVAIPAETHLTRSDTRTRANHCFKYKHYNTRTTQFKNSFFPSTIPIWNNLTSACAEAETLTAFKSQLQRQ